MLKLARFSVKPVFFKGVYYASRAISLLPVNIIFDLKKTLLFLNPVSFFIRKSFR